MSRSVLVTGANRGIGLAIARAFAKNGDRVAAGYRDQEPPTDLFAVRCDVTDTVSVDEAFTAAEAMNGPVEVLVANAGIMRDRLALATSDEDFEAILDTNLTGTFRVTRRALAGMVTQRWGRLIFISSFSGMLGSPGQASYAASKTALLGMARSIAREVGTRGITANVVAPGFIDTDMVSGLAAKRRAEFIGMTALGRPGTPEEVANVVRFLADQDASYVTGAFVPVAGGLGMGC
jgi:3-oxoacyl-[acyl-carrier protein] reductase